MPTSLIFKDAEKARDNICAEDQKRIRQLYSDWAKEVGERAEYYGTKTNASAYWQQQQMLALQKQLENEAKEIYKQIQSGAKESMYLVADKVVGANAAYLTSLGFPKDGVNAALTSVPTQVVNNIVTGQIYDSGWSLSKAIWSDQNKTLSDIYTIVAKGRAMNMSAYDVSKMLEKYVNPSRAKMWNLKMADGVRIYKKAVDYNAQRLVRTLNQHAYQQSVIQVSKDNPFIGDIIWHANGSRVCPLCIDRDGNHYKPEDLPMDHPNGMCTMEPNTDIDSTIDQLADWINSPDGTFPEIDEFAKQFGYVPESKVSVQINNSEPKINSAHYIAQGKDITDIWKRRPEQFDFEIEDVINAQGFDGLPRVVSSDEFDKAVKESNIIMQRGYRASDKEILNAYRDELYYGKWYVDCSVGGAGYGKGMYTAYNTGTEISEHTLDMAKSYANLGYNMVGNVETMTFDPSFKVIDYDDAAKLTNQFRENFKIGGEKREHARSEMINSMLSKYDLNDNEKKYYRIRYVNDAPNPDDLMQISKWYMGLSQDDRARIDKFAIDNDFFNKGLEIKSSLDKLANIDEGAVAALYGYDGIVGDPLSYGEGELVVLNRTKIIIKEP